MRLEGSLDAFSLPDIFALLSMTKKTGGLHLRRDDRHGAVWLKDGSLTGGRSQIDRQSLARRVVVRSDLDVDSVETAIQTAHDSGGPLLAAILKLDLLEQDVVRSCAYEQIVDVVFDLLRWDAGDFEFVVDESNPDDVDVARAVDEVVGDARQRLAEWETAKSSLPAADAVLHLRAVAPADVMLEHDQWSLLVLADGQRTVAEIVDLSGRGEFAAVRALGDLLAAGLLCEPTGGAVAHVVSRGALLDGFEGNPVVHRIEPEPVVVPAEAVAVEAEVVLVEAEPEPVVVAVAEVHESLADLEAQQLAAAQESELVENIDFHKVVDAELGGPDADGVESSEWEAAVSELPAQPLRSVARDLTSVTPQRPEPFLPARQPEHAESVSVSTTTHGALAAAASAPAPHIERDPSVNKSLLLRLIAGVRGL